MGDKCTGSQSSWEPRDFSEEVVSKPIYLQAEQNSPGEGEGTRWTGQAGWWEQHLPRTEGWRGGPTYLGEAVRAELQRQIGPYHHGAFQGYKGWG